MKQSKNTSILLSLTMTWMCLAAGFVLIISRPSQASFHMLGITLTPSPEGQVAPTETPFGWEPTNTLEPLPAATSTPIPRTRQGDPPSAVTPVLPVSGIGEPGSQLSAVSGEPNPVALESLPQIQRLVIPSIDTDARVVPVFYERNTWDLAHLTVEAGWLAESSLPREGGNTILTGHVLYGRYAVPFRWMPQLENGSAVYLYSEEGVYLYQVERQEVVSQYDLSVLEKGSGPRLTLITCANWDRTRRIYEDRQVAFARLIDFFPNPPRAEKGEVARE